MSMQTKGDSRTRKKCQIHNSAKRIDKNSHQQSDNHDMLTAPPETTSKKLKECPRNAPQIHIIHISDLKSILNEMITTFEVQSLLSGSSLLCVDMNNLPQLLRHIIEHRCYNIHSKELCPANNVYSDEGGLLNESDAESGEVCWSPRDAQSVQKAFTPGSMCKTKKRCPASISQDEVAGCVSRIMERSRNLPRKSFPILNPEDLPKLIQREKVTLSQSENSICVSDVPRLIIEVMNGEISLPINEIFIENQENQVENHSGENDTKLSPRTNNRATMPQHQSILESSAQLKPVVNEQKLDGADTENRREIEAPSISEASTTIEQRKETIPREFESSHDNFLPPKPPKRKPRVSSIFGDICRRSSKRYMEPTIASAARAAFDDPFYPPSSHTKNYPENASNGISKVRAVSVPANNDRCVPPEIRQDTTGTQGNRKVGGRRYRLKEWRRPWESPFYNPNQLFCLEEITKMAAAKTKVEKRLLEEVRTQRPSPRPSTTKGNLGKKAQVTKSEGSLTEEHSGRVESESVGRPRSEERFLRVAERLKTVVVPRPKMPAWNPAPKSSPRDEMVISLQNPNGMKIIDKMIKPKKLSKALQSKN